MNYIVLDLEWNQPFSTKTTICSPVMLHGEIIQIGAVKLDEQHHILDTFKIMVSPQYYTKMHWTVSKLTGITSEDFQYGFLFPVAFKHFSKWCGSEFAILTWGSDDIEILRENMLLHELNTEWIPETYNLQIIFDDQISKERRQISLSDAMQKLGEPALKAHDALNDAKNTVCICMHLDMIKGLSMYAALKKQMRCFSDCAGERMQPPKTYSSKDEVFADPAVINFHCPTCGASVTCVDFVHYKSDRTICIGKCANGDELFVRFKFTKWWDGSLRVSRILYEMTEENKAYYLNKKQKVEQEKADFLQRIAAAS